MRFTSRSRLLFLFAAPLVTAAIYSALPLLSAGCEDPNEQPPTDSSPQVRPGDICEQPQANSQRMRFTPLQVFMEPCTGDPALCATRDVNLILEPDTCDDKPFTLKSSSADLIVPAAGKFGLYVGSQTIHVVGAKSVGTTTLTASIKREDGTEATTDLQVITLDPTMPKCSGTESMASLTEDKTLAGKDGLAGASIGLPKHANAPQTGSFLWRVEPFAASLSCGSMDLPIGYAALGPAITFGDDESLKLQREIPMSVPVNPALVPQKGRMRHVQVLYSGPAFKKPRIVPVADVRFDTVGGAWAMTFKAPRLGTYQAIIANDAGSRVKKRKLTHRAVVGVSMGGIGTSMFGLRHHDKFDVVAPLGGPGSWTWLMHHIERNHLGGFRPIPKGTTIADVQLEKVTCDTNAECQVDETCIGKTATKVGRCTIMPTPEDPYEHPQTFDNWWAEYPRTGTGGRFPRQDYAQIFRDLSLAFGNPNGENLTKGGEFLPAGVPPTEKSVVGDHPGDECAVWVDPIDGHPNHDKQAELASTCPAERCANTLTLHNYYDDEFNPDGAFPVITVCDGSDTDEDQTPWANAWDKNAPNKYPLEVGLAVDYNGNGVRDELEPIIRSAHEPWKDTGTDGVASALEPGYVVGVNEDPNGDDYNAQYNPGGTENDYRYQQGEPFDDIGLDGVVGTPQQPAYPVGYQVDGDGYDVGEGDQKFTVTSGLDRFWNHDPVNMLLDKSNDVPAGPLTDEALSRIDLWTDGGLRDIFNFHVAAQHMIGSLVPRGRVVNYYTQFANIPGFTTAEANQFTPSKIDWADVPGGVLMRYGAIDPTEKDLETGSGQHVGTVTEIAFRLQSSLYYIGSRWPETELRSFVKSSNDDPDPDAQDCEVFGSCTEMFKSSTGRVGPVTINFPPGYAHIQQKDRRYPVIYMLHGYGQTPEDLGAAIVFVANWMNNSNDSIATRLPKALLVYVDGRCREGANGKAECLRGSFFTDSAREGGFLDESWWLELMNYVDGKYRTMGSTDVDWTE